MNRSEGRRDVASAVRREALAEAERAEMHGLLATYFDGVSAAQFAHDLAEKDWVLRVRREGRLMGFSTLAAYRTRLPGETVNVIYSGDTIMAPEAWGSPTLARAWIALVRRVQATLPAGRCYWLLLSSGFRTYRFLPVFWREYWPRAGCATPPDVAATMAALAGERFGKHYDPSAGVVRLESPQRLRGRLAAVRDGDPRARFFAEANPGHAEGDELVCLAELSVENLTAAGRRVTREAGL